MNQGQNFSKITEKINVFFKLVLKKRKKDAILFLIES